jgi:hypothetical protein
VEFTAGWLSMTAIVLLSAKTRSMCDMGMSLTFSAFQTNQVKEPGTFNQITRSKPLRIRQKTVQPFQPSFLNPNRRATLFSGEKVDRSTYTQSDPSSLRVLGNLPGENLLLRHSNCQKN